MSERKKTAGKKRAEPLGGGPMSSTLGLLNARLSPGKTGKKKRRQ